MFFFLPIGVNYRSRRYPVVTFTIIGVCILFYLVQFMWEMLGDEKEVQTWVFEYLWLTPSKSYWWSYLTSMFVHADFFHIFGNMLYLFLFGSCVEDLMGRTRYIFFYLLCGLFADYSNILVSADHFASPIPSGGASGAISGCIGGFLLLLAKNQIEFKWFFYFFFRVWVGNFSLPAWVVISCWFLSDAIQMVLARLAERHHSGGIAFAAHVGGMALGMGLVALDKRRMRRSGALDWIEEQDEEPTIGVLPTRPAPQPSAAWHSSDVRTQPRAQPQATAAPVAAPIEGATIYLSWDGVNYGPYALSQIQPMFKRGEIPPHASYWQHGMEDWRAAEELRDPGTG